MVDEWLTMYKNLLKRGNYVPELIWNCDKTFLSLAREGVSFWLMVEVLHLLKPQLRKANI